MKRVGEVILTVLGILVLVFGLFWLSGKVTGGFQGLQGQPKQSIVYNNTITIGE